MEEENEILGPDQPWSPDMLFTPSVEEEEEEQLSFFETVLNKQQEAELGKAREQERIEEERIKTEEEEKERVRNVGTILNPHSGVSVEAANAVQELIGDEFMEEFFKVRSYNSKTIL